LRYFQILRFVNCQIY